MVTASHNPIQDNGLKLVEPLGEMLVPEYEAHACALANAGNTVTDVEEVINTIMGSFPPSAAGEASVIYAYDTRPSCGGLVEALVEGMLVLEGTTPVAAGEGTTPLLHYMVRAANDAAFGVPSKIGYLTAFADAFAAFVALLPEEKRRESGGSEVVVDPANGVGRPVLEAMKVLSPSLLGFVRLAEWGEEEGEEVRVLNHGCGADFVKTGQKAPAYLEGHPGRAAAFDGDADRVVYFYTHPQTGFCLLDGDRIAVLMADYISGLIKCVGLESELSLAVVQTAYANGGSTKYLRDEVGMEVRFTKTGVKHLHHVAVEYDVGVYFEANGHGTVVFSKQFGQVVEAKLADVVVAGSGEEEEEVVRALRILRLLPKLVNQAVGDAIADMLFVEGILMATGKTVDDWAGMYEDLPNRLTKVAVADRSVFETTNADMQLVAPAGFQEAIDGLVASVGGEGARAFVRPSGTEDVVRVYAEARGREEADALAVAVAGYVYDHAGGRGERVEGFE